MYLCLYMSKICRIFATELSENVVFALDMFVQMHSIM